jgi:predicted transcriptional regulator
MESCRVPATITTSVRLPQRLSRELERCAKKTKRGKNWVMKEALEHYLLGSSHDQLREAARRQSQLASNHTPADAAWTESGADVDDWKA